MLSVGAGFDHCRYCSNSGGRGLGCPLTSLFWLCLLKWSKLFLFVRVEMTLPFYPDF